MEMTRVSSGLWGCGSHPWLNLTQEIVNCITPSITDEEHTNDVNGSLNGAFAMKKIGQIIIVNGKPDFFWCM